MQLFLVVLGLVALSKLAVIHSKTTLISFSWTQSNLIYYKNLFSKGLVEQRLSGEPETKLQGLTLLWVPLVSLRESRGVIPKSVVVSSKTWALLSWRQTSYWGASLKTDVWGGAFCLEHSWKMILELSGSGVKDPQGQGPCDVILSYQLYSRTVYTRDLFRLFWHSPVFINLKFVLYSSTCIDI